MYFAGDGSGETQHVFLNGNHLLERFQAATGTFVVAETGFGTGRNFLLTADAFLRLAPDCARLVFISIENQVLDEQTLAAVHANLAPAHRGRAGQLRSALSAENPRIEFDAGRVVLCLLRDDVDAALRASHFQADAWFLDGFAPAKNPAMWSPEVLSEVAGHTRRGGTFATYTAAGAVRRALRDSGFEVERTPGFGNKREMMRGSYAPRRSASTNDVVISAPRRVVIQGAGLAGVTVARAFAERGTQVALVDPNGVGSGASGIPAAVVRPRLWVPGKGPVPDAELVANAFRWTSAWLDRIETDQFRRCGVLMPANPEEADALERRARNSETADIASWVDAGEATRLCGLSITSRGAAWIPSGGVLDVGGLLTELASHAKVEVRPDRPSWECDLEVRSHAEVRAADVGVAPTEAVRGQAIALRWPDHEDAPRTVVCGSGYLSPPDRERLVWCGATYDRGCESNVLRPDDDSRILAKFDEMPALAKSLSSASVMHRFAAVRRTTADRLPILGWLQEGVDAPTMVSLGHGSRGAVTAPWGAALLVAAALREPMPIAPMHLRRIAPLLDVRRRRR